MLKGVKKVRTKNNDMLMFPETIYHVINNLQQKTVYFLPWLVWTVLYFLISLGIFTYSIILGGETLVQKLVPPLVYLLITSLWVYCFVCVVAYYQYLKKHPDSRQVHIVVPKNLSSLGKLFF